MFGRKKSGPEALSEPAKAQWDVNQGYGPVRGNPFAANEQAPTATARKSVSGEDHPAHAPPIKTFEVTNQHTFRHNHLVIQHHGQPIFWTTKTTKAFGMPHIDIHAEGEKGPIVAACELVHMSPDVNVCLGDPGADDEGNFERVTCEGPLGKAFRFTAGGRVYRWKRTHAKELGASRFSDKEFKLVADEHDQDGDDASVLAVFVHTHTLLGKLHRVGRLNFYAELGHELELMSVTTILGIEQVVAEAQGSEAAGGRGSEVSPGVTGGSNFL